MRACGMNFLAGARDFGVRLHASDLASPSRILPTSYPVVRRHTARKPTGEIDTERATMHANCGLRAHVRRCREMAMRSLLPMSSIERAARARFVSLAVASRPGSGEPLR